MTPRASLLLLPLLLGPNPTLWQSKEGNMHILASLGGQRSELSRASDVVHQSVDCDTNARGESHTPVLASQMSLNLSDSVHVGLCETDCRLFVNGLQGLKPSKVSTSNTLDGARVSEINDSVTTPEVAVNTVKSDRQSALPRVPQALPPDLDWLLNPDKGRTLIDRVMARLIQAEAHENDQHFRSDYRQSLICLSLASKGNTEPFLASSYQMYGLHPDKVFPKIVSNRRERLGREFGQWWTPEGVLLPDVEVPKMPATRVNDSHTAGAGAGAENTGCIKGSEAKPSAPVLLTGTGDATGDGTSSELPGSTSPASLPMKGRTA